MKRLLILLALLPVVLTVFPRPCPVHAHVEKKAGVRAVPRRVRSSAMSRSPLTRRIIVWQRGLQARLSRMARSLKDDFSIGHLLDMFALAILYGAVHALGPGHGKIVLGSCTIGQDYSIKDALKGASVFTLVHNGSAILLYTVFALFFGTLRHRTSHDITTLMYNVSGGMLALLGVILLVTVVFRRQIHSHAPERLQNLSLPLACAAAGAVPCPGTLVIMFFGSSLGMLWLGYALAAGFMLGMLTTLSTVATVLASGRRLATLPVRSETVFRVLKAAGAVLLIVVGIYLVALY